VTLSSGSLKICVHHRNNLEQYAMSAGNLYDKISAAVIVDLSSLCRACRCAVYRYNIMFVYNILYCMYLRISHVLTTAIHSVLQSVFYERFYIGPRPYLDFKMIIKKYRYFGVLPAEDPNAMRRLVCE